MGIGFELSESMAGRFHLFDDPLTERAVRIDIRLSVDGLRRFVRERRIDAEGVIVAEGLAEQGGAGRAVRGTLTWKLLDENRVPYDFSFEGDDGQAYRLRGQRDFFLHNAIGSLTTLEASLYDDANREIGRALLAFEPPLELPALVRSLRPRLRMWSFARRSKS